MYNPDQRYDAHKLYLQELQNQAAEIRMLRASSSHRRASGWRAIQRLSARLMVLGIALKQQMRRVAPHVGRMRFMKLPERDA